MFKHVRGGTWPIGWDEYAYSPFESAKHNIYDYTQSPRQAFIEGWSDFYATAVEGWVDNPSNPYSEYYGNINIENLQGATYDSFDFSSVPNGLGYNNEAVCAAAFYDYYDPVSSDDNLQTSFLNILNTLADQSNTMVSYVNIFANKPFLTDEQRHNGIAILQILRMDPVASYGNVEVKVKNNFESGEVILGTNTMTYETINTLNEETPGTIERPRLWMNDLYLQAIENQLDPQGYTMKFQHTHPTKSSYTWTTLENTDTKYFTESWQKYNEQLTHRANFDRECNVNISYQSLDGVTLPAVPTSIQRSRTLLSITAPVHTVNGVDHTFYQWSDGSTENPRNFTVNENVNLTALYKVHLAASSNIALGNNNQRKLVRDNTDKLNLVYESSNAMWTTSSTNNGAGWINDELVVTAPVQNAVYREPTLLYNPNTGIVSNVYDEVWIDAAGEEWSYNIRWDGIINNNAPFRLGGGIVGPSKPIAVMTKTQTTAFNIPSMLAVVWKEEIGPQLNIALYQEPITVEQSSYGISGTSNAINHTFEVVPGQGPDGHPGWLFYLAWEVAGTSATSGIYYSFGFLDVTLGIANPTNISWTTTQVISNNGGTTNTKPFIAIDYSNRATLAWISETNSEQGNVKVQRWSHSTQDLTYGTITLPAYSNTSGTPVSISMSDYRNNPSKQNDLTLVWTTSANDIVAIHFTNDAWGSPYKVATGMNASIEMNPSGTSDERKIVYLTGSSAPYLLNFTTITQQTSMSNQVATHWNLVSVPLYLSSYEQAVTFPGTVSGTGAYGFDGTGYVMENPVSFGKAYWVKYSSPTTLNYTGLSATKHSIPVTTGWNMIGSLSTSIPVGTVTCLGTTLKSRFFGYTPGVGSYEAAFIEPGKGYWVKVENNGTFILDASAVMNQYTVNSLTELTSSESPPAWPPPPIFLQPANGATGTGSSTTLRWSNNVIRSDSFKVQWSTDSAFESDLHYSPALADTQYILSNLGFSTTYYWTVKGKIDGLWTSYREPAWSFTVKPPAPSLVSPASSAIVSNPPRVIWRRITGAATYRLQVSTTSSFTSTAKDTSGVSDSTLVLSGLAGATQYYWRVNTTVTGKGTSDWSGTSSFKVIPPSPVQLTGSSVQQIDPDGIKRSHPRLTWTQSNYGPNINYKLYQYFCSGSVDCINDVTPSIRYSGTATSYTDIQMSTGTSETYAFYYVTVTETLLNSVSSPSNKVSFRTDMPEAKQGRKNDDRSEAIPTIYFLSENFPNPFNPITAIRYGLPEDSHVQLRVFNTLGVEVATLVDEMQNTGYKSVEFNASTLPSGVYFYRLVAKAIPLGQAGTFTDIKKMLLAK
ncbi:MAG: T9SS type A sorting domain-containing protein [Ignavibacteriae bacterium]|nr:T9SS type A sorting domain-containing protein [Ignavibacteriota bacterium]